MGEEVDVGERPEGAGAGMGFRARLGPRPHQGGEVTHPSSLSQPHKADQFSLSCCHSQSHSIFNKGRRVIRPTAVSAAGTSWHTAGFPRAFLRTRDHCAETEGLDKYEQDTSMYNNVESRLKIKKGL